ncbi:MAG: ATP-binding protein [Culturomica sp.]|jgi:serine/threonine-protein kinase RsbW|nr:ATP-binding protein [Culturomica sp.]
MNKIELRISSRVENIVQVEQFIETFETTFGLTPEVFGKISLSVIEAVNNAILFGNRQAADKYVTVSAWKEELQFFVSVADEGEGFDYSVIPDPTLPDNVVKVAGRGLYLMKILSDDLVFENGGAKVTLVFNLCEV